MKHSTGSTKILLRLSRQLAQTCQKLQQSALRLAAATQPPVAPSPNQAVPGRTKRTKRCYFPGCRNTAAPRFGMFCAARHKDLPAREKKSIRASR